MDDKSELYQKVIKKFTKDAQQALVVAEEKAQVSGMNYVPTEHLLIGILSQRESSGWDILMRFGVSQNKINSLVKAGYLEHGVICAPMKQIVEEATMCARHFGHSRVGTTHLLLALCYQENTSFAGILKDLKVNLEDLKKDVVRILTENSDGGGGAASLPSLVHLPPSEHGGGAAATAADNDAEPKSLFTSKAAAVTNIFNIRDWQTSMLA